MTLPPIPKTPILLLGLQLLTNPLGRMDSIYKHYGDIFTSSCIAGTFAMFQMKLVLATIISRYELALVNRQPEQQKIVGLQCHPKSGVKMVINSLLI